MTGTARRWNESRGARRRAASGRKVVTELIGIRQVELRRFHFFKRRNDASFLVVAAAERAEHQEVAFALRENDPFAPACPYQ